MRPGEKIVSQQSGFEIDLPPSKVGEIEIMSFFGDSQISEGAIATVVAGSLPPDPAGLFVTEL